jgi:hypothetical protein
MNMPRTLLCEKKNTCLYCHHKVKNLSRHLAQTSCAARWNELIQNRASQGVSRDIGGMWVGHGVSSFQDEDAPNMFSSSRKRRKVSTSEAITADHNSGCTVSELTHGMKEAPTGIERTSMSNYQTEFEFNDSPTSDDSAHGFQNAVDFVTDHQPSVQ